MNRIDYETYVYEDLPNYKELTLAEETYLCELYGCTSYAISEFVKLRSDASYREEFEREYHRQPLVQYLEDWLNQFRETLDADEVDERSEAARAAEWSEPARNEWLLRSRFLADLDRFDSEYTREIAAHFGPNWNRVLDNLDIEMAVESDEPSTAIIFSMWWDRRHGTGETFTLDIERARREARLMLATDK